MKNDYAAKLKAQYDKGYNKGADDGTTIAFCICLIAFNNLYGEILPDEDFTKYEKELNEVYADYVGDCISTKADKTKDITDVSTDVMMMVKDIRRRRGMGEYGKAEG